MKYRVRLDLSFNDEADARAVMSYARQLTDRAVNINTGRENEELSFLDLELCRHDESLPCTRLERVEIRT
ncbi:MAG: hypothetical protein HY667_00705 [Chloroflexi bacterium]|nr:hypothetical protein [Chloroflexota bacterium]